MSDEREFEWWFQRFLRICLHSRQHGKGWETQTFLFDLLSNIMKMI